MAQAGRTSRWSSWAGNAPAIAWLAWLDGYRAGKNVAADNLIKEIDAAASGRAVITAGKGGKWAIQDSNPSTDSTGKHNISSAGAAKGAVVGTNVKFAGALAAILALPLTDADKAEAVRRLLKGSGVE